MKLTNEDLMKIKNFLEQYVEHLRSTGRSSDQYKADAIEDLIGRL